MEDNRYLSNNVVDNQFGNSSQYDNQNNNFQGNNYNNTDNNIRNNENVVEKELKNKKSKFGFIVALLLVCL